MQIFFWKYFPESLTLTSLKVIDAETLFKADPGNTNWGGSLSTIDLLVLTRGRFVEHLSLT